MAYYDNFSSLSSLRVFYPETTKNSAVIYGNGRNQVEVMVAVKILKNNGNNKVPVVMTEQEMLNSIYLCDYYTGQKISTSMGSDWNYDNKKGQYSVALEYTSSRMNDNHSFSMDDGYNYLKLYVYSKKQSSGKVIAAGINIPTVGEFNTTANGTLTNNGANGGPFKMPGSVTAIALAPYKYTVEDFSLNTDTTSLSSIANQGVHLRDIRWTNYYLDIRKSQHNISSLSSSLPSGSKFGSHYKGWWIYQSFDCAADYGKGPISKTLYVQFGKYSFPCTSTINKQSGACFTGISGTSSVPTSWDFDGETYVNIYDQYGNHAAPVLIQSIDHIKITGVRSPSRVIPEDTIQYVANHGVPENIVQHIVDSTPNMICGVLFQNGNSSDFKSFVNASPAPEQGAKIDTHSLMAMMSSHEVTHVICSVPDAMSHDVTDYQQMSDRDGLKYLLVFWPSLECRNISPRTEFGYENRPYIYGQYDCYSLVRDYLLREKGVVLNDYPREVYSNGLGANIFEMQAPEEGFVKVDDDSLQPGDVLVFNLPSTRLQHAAVYIGNGQMLHHLPPGQSRQETCNEIWKKRISSVWRHNNLINK